jgi:hypothetical protein
VRTTETEVRNSKVKALTRRKAISQASVNGFLHERVPQGPLILVSRIFVRFFVLAIKGGLKACQRGFALDMGFCFFKDLEAILYN